MRVVDALAMEGPCTSEQLYALCTPPTGLFRYLDACGDIDRELRQLVAEGVVAPFDTESYALHRRVVREAL